MTLIERVVNIKAAEAGIVKALDLGEREFLAVISTPDLDRDGEVVAARAFEPLPDRIIVEIDHASFGSDAKGVRAIAGSGVPIYVGDDLLLRGSYASTGLGEEVRTLVNEGHLTKLSIGFLPERRETIDGVPHITKGQLINVSFVTVPANDNARVLSSKSVETSTVEGATGDGPVAGVVLGLDRPESVHPDEVDAWTEAVQAFASGWTSRGDTDATEAAEEEGAAEDDSAAPDDSAALRARQRARASAIIAMASHTNEGEQENE